MISAPHGVSQIRLGRHKVAELGTIPIACIIAENTNSSLIVKTKNNNDDANFDAVSPYRGEIKNQIEENGVKYIFDIHDMAKSRNCDINLGINFGQNIKNNLNLFNSILEKFKEAGFLVSVDQPFAAGPQTISGYFAKNFNVWTIQIEINCDITNNKNNIARCNLLAETLIEIVRLVQN